MKELICPSCERPLPANSPQQLCPLCALAGAQEFNSSAGVPSIEEIQPSFPEFTIKECIDRGGMGIVYRAYQPSEDREVALKILDPALSKKADFAERFSREARTLEQLDHPNIVSIYDHGITDDFTWITMEYVDGVNLRQAMQTAQFTSQQALEIIPSLCSALQYAHQSGVFHRDVKPENILIHSNGTVKVADFGIARLVGDLSELTLTRTGSTLGSTAYMAPEQIETPQDVDHRADIYSLGVVFYEMLTGSLPLGRFPAPSEKSGSHPGLDEVVFRALEKEREKRFQNADDMSREVSSPSTSEIVSNLQPPLPWANIAIWTTLIGLITCCVGVLINDTFAAIGLIALITGIMGCWWLLAEIRAGRHSRDDRSKLMRVSVKAPLFILLLCLIPIGIWRLSSAKKSEELRWQVEREARKAEAALQKAQASYNHSSPQAAMKAVIQAAQNEDQQAFALGFQGDVILSMAYEDPGLISTMKEYAKKRYLKVTSTKNYRAQVLVLDDQKQQLYNLIYEGERWCIVGEHSNQALEEIPLLETDTKAMLSAARDADIQTFRKYFTKSVLSLWPTDPASQKEILNDWATLNFTKVYHVDLQQDPKEGEVLFTSDSGGETTFRFLLLDNTWKLRLPEQELSHYPPNPKLPGYSTPVDTFETALHAAKDNNSGLFEEAFTTSLLALMDKQSLSSAEVIEAFLNHRIATIDWESKDAQYENPQQTQAILKLGKPQMPELILKMIKQPGSGKWRFTEPFFLQP